MKTILLGYLCVIVLLFYSCSNKNETISIIPQPVSIETSSGYFRLNADTRIIIGDEILKTSSALFRQVAGNILKADLSYASGSEMDKNCIFVSVDTSLKEEAYSLSVARDSIVIRAGGWRGALYAFQTLRQLLPENSENQTIDERKEIRIPCVTINDEPRFAWRGINVDVARHFFSKENLMKFIDVISLYKYNILHLHLTDDQGWRIEIKKYPELTEKGAWRPLGYYLEDECKKIMGPYMKYDERFTRKNDGRTEYGGYYTQEDMKEIVAYALERGISILPEIDMPAHSGTAISIFPQLNCENPGPICPCNEFSYEFAKNVFSEIAEIFPFEYIHLGCDEVDRSGWRNSPACNRFMKENGIENVEQLQSHFTREMEKFFNSKGKKLVGWDEILEGGISETATAMYWRTWVPNNLNNLLKYGNDVVIATTTYSYFFGAGLKHCHLPV